MSGRRLTVRAVKMKIWQAKPGSATHGDFRYHTPNPQREKVNLCAKGKM